MGALREARRRALSRRGRSMTLRRLVSPPGTYASAAVTGFSADYAPDDLTPPLVQGDRRLEILHADLVAAGFPWPPREPDEVLDGGESFTVIFAAPVWEGTERIGWTLAVRGG